MHRLFLLLSFVAYLGVAQAETVKGRIAAVSQQAGTIQIEVKAKVSVWMEIAYARASAGSAPHRLRAPTHVAS